MPNPMGFGIGSARMIGVASEILAGRPVDRPSTVDLVEIAVATRLQLFGLLGRELAAFILDDEGALLDRRCCEEAEPGARAADTKGMLAGHGRTSTTIRARAKLAHRPLWSRHADVRCAGAIAASLAFLTATLFRAPQ